MALAYSLEQLWNSGHPQLVHFICPENGEASWFLMTWESITRVRSTPQPRSWSFRNSYISMEKMLLRLEAFQQRPDVILLLVLYGKIFHIWISSELQGEVSTDANCWAALSVTDLVGRSDLGPQAVFETPHLTSLCCHAWTISIESDISAVLRWLIICVFGVLGQSVGGETKELHQHVQPVTSLSEKRNPEPPSGTEWKSTRLDFYMLVQL